jgi:hypothetical protein
VCINSKIINLSGHSCQYELRKMRADLAGILSGFCRCRTTDSGAKWTTTESGEVQANGGFGVSSLEPSRDRVFMISSPVICMILFGLQRIGDDRPS